MDSILNYIKQNKPKMVFLTFLIATFFILLLSETTIDIDTEALKGQTNIERETSTTEKIEKKGDVIIFSHPQCIHCHRLEEFFKEINIEKKFPHLNFVKYDISQTGNSNLMQFYGRSLGIDIRSLGTPFLIYGDKYILGFGAPETTGKEILELLSDSSKETISSSKVSFKQNAVTTERKETLTLPVFGEISLVKTSLPMLAIIIGAVDGFNPCAMWVLVFLISIIAELRDKKKIYLLIGTFLAASGILYFLFMTAWLNLFLFIGYVKAITLVIGLAAIYFGVTSVYDYIKNGGQAECHVDFKTQTKTKSKIQQLVTSPLNIATFFGIVALAFAVNSIEFVCSAALPAIFTQVLTLADISLFSYYMYILLYVFFFMLDDLIIFLFAAFAIEKFAGEKYAGYCKIIGGVILIILGIFMTFFPNLLR